MSRSNPDLAPSTSTAEPCPVCGGPADLAHMADGSLTARCPGAGCPKYWIPLDEWNSSKLQLVSASEGGKVDEMPRADGPDILRDFTKQANTLIEGVATLAVTSIEQETEMELARVTLKAVVKLRNLVDKKRKEVGLEALRRKQKVDAEFGKVIIRLEAEETRLEEIATFKTRQLAAAKMRLQQEREDMLRPYVSEADLLQIAVGLAEMPEMAFLHMRDGYEMGFKAKLERDKQDRLAAEEAERIAKEEMERLRRETVVAIESEAQARREHRAALAVAETERLRVAEVARKEQARLQAIADAAELEARTIREEQERLSSKRQAAQQATDAEKLEDIAKRCASPSWPEMSEPWAHDIIHDEHVRLILAGLAMWIREQIKEHQPKIDL